MSNDGPKDYMLWRKNHMPDQEELEEQRRYVFKDPVLLSVVVPVYNTPEKYLLEMIASVTAQTYPNWELCIADGCSTNPEVRKIIKKAAKADRRVKYVFLKANGGISVHTNEAAKLAGGDFIVFADSDDILAPNALFEVAKVIEDDPDVDFIFTDSEDISSDTGEYNPRFKPDWNPLMFLSNNYIVHLVVVRKTAAYSVGMMDSEYDTFQDTDFLYKLTETTDRIRHIPKILYSWRRHRESISKSILADKKDESFKKIVFQSKREHLKRLGFSDGETEWFFFGVRGNIKQKLSVIAPFYGGLKLLSNFLDSVFVKKEENDIEVIVVNATEVVTCEAIEALKPASLKAVALPKGIDPSSISAAYNFGAKIAAGEYLAFANYCSKFSGLEFYNPLLRLSLYPGTALVAGTVENKERFNSAALMGDGCGIGFPPEEIFIRTRRSPREVFKDLPQLLSAALMKNVTAVPDAFTLLKKSVFGESGGFNENFPRVFFLMDLSLRLNEMGYRHAACSSRITLRPRKHPLYAEETDIFYKELELFRERHNGVINSPERYANPNTI